MKMIKNGFHCWFLSYHLHQTFFWWLSSASFSFIIFLNEKIPKLRCDIYSRKDKSYRCHDLLHDTIVYVYPLVRFFGVAFCVSTESRGVIDGSPNRVVAVLGVTRSERQGGKEEVKSWKAGREFSAMYYSGCPSILYSSSYILNTIFSWVSSFGPQSWVWASIDYFCEAARAP